MDEKGETQKLIHEEQEVHEYDSSAKIDLNVSDDTLRELTREQLVTLYHQVVKFSNKLTRKKAEEIVVKGRLPLGDLIQAHLKIDPPEKEHWPRLENKFKNGEYILCPYCDFIFIRDILKRGVIKGDKMLCYNCHNLFPINWMVT